MSQPATPLTVEDQRVVDMVNAVLVDPDLHTDARMRLSARLTELLEATHDEMRRAAPRPERRAGKDHEAKRHPVDLLSSVLVDPSLHTDLRLELHARIGELLREEDAAGDTGPQRG